MDLDKAEDMLRNVSNIVFFIRSGITPQIFKVSVYFIQSMKWRKENQVESILKTGLDPELCKKFPYYLDGHDKQGRPGQSLTIYKVFV